MKNTVTEWKLVADFGGRLASTASPPDLRASISPSLLISQTSSGITSPLSVDGKSESFTQPRVQPIHEVPTSPSSYPSPSAGRPPFHIASSRPVSACPTVKCHLFLKPRTAFCGLSNWSFEQKEPEQIERGLRARWGGRACNRRRKKNPHIQ